MNYVDQCWICNKEYSECGHPRESEVQDGAPYQNFMDGNTRVKLDHWRYAQENILGTEDKKEWCPACRNQSHGNCILKLCRCYLLGTYKRSEEMEQRKLGRNDPAFEMGGPGSIPESPPPPRPIMRDSHFRKGNMSPDDKPSGSQSTGSEPWMGQDYNEAWINFWALSEGDRRKFYKELQEYSSVTQSDRRLLWIKKMINPIILLIMVNLALLTSYSVVFWSSNTTLILTLATLNCLVLYGISSPRKRAR